MRAAVVDRYGGPEVVRVTDVPEPAPRRGTVRVRVAAAAVTSGDARIRAARFPPGFAVPARIALGLRGPRRRVLGVCFSGVVDAVGPGVDGFAPGDRVCGMTGRRMGAHAELVTAPAGRVTHLPAGVTHDDAAGLLFGGSAALHFLRDRARVRPGESVLVNGASGAVGSNAVQVARHLGGTVTAVTSGRNAELATRLGADRVVDHAQQEVADLPERFDVVVDAVGNLSVARGRRLLREGGRLALVVAGLGETVRARGDVLAGPAPERAETFAELLRWLAEGVLTVVHDSAFPLDDIAEAHRRVDTGHKVGNVLVHP